MLPFALRVGVLCAVAGSVAGLVSPSTAAASQVVPVEDEEHAPPPRESDFTLIPPRSFVVPVAEVGIFHLSLLAYDEHVVWNGAERVSLSSIGRNLRGGWTLDGDRLTMNYIGHPIHGALHFNMARSNGLSFWESFAIAVGSAFLWEIAGESEPPSVNDFTNSAYAGSLLGESFHRIAELLLDGPRPPGLIASVIAFGVDPFGYVNRRVFGQRQLRSQRPRPPLYEAHLRLEGLALDAEPFGLAAASPTRAQPLQAGGGADVLYGFPDAPQTRAWGPLEHFQLAATIAGPGSYTLDARLLALLAGRGFGTSGRACGVWGVFGGLDFVSAPSFRFASNGLGLGAALHAEPASKWRLRTTGVAAGLPVGAAGARQQTDFQTTQIRAPRQYANGPGVQGLFYAELVRQDLGALDVRAQGWGIRNNGRGGWERIGAFAFGFRIRPIAGQQVGAELTVLRRRAAVGELRQGGLIGRLIWRIPLGETDVSWP